MGTDGRILCLKQDPREIAGRGARSSLVNAATCLLLSIPRINTRRLGLKVECVSCLPLALFQDSSSTMFSSLPKLEYGLTHPHPRNRWFLFSTIVLFLLVTPVLVLVNSKYYKSYFMHFGLRLTALKL